MENIYGNIWYINGYVVSIWGFPGQWISLSFPDDLWKHPFTLAAPTKQGPWALLRRQETGQSSASGNQRSLVCRTGQISKIGWWFGTLILFFHILGIVTPTDELAYFSEGLAATTNEISTGIVPKWGLPRVWWWTRGFRGILFSNKPIYIYIYSCPYDLGKYG